MNHRRPAGRILSTAAAALGLLLVLVASACTAKPQTSASPTSGSSAVRMGGTLIAAQTSDADPGSFLKTSIGNVLTEYAVLETLTMQDQTSGQPKGILATSWDLSPDGLTMTVQLRKDVKFHSGAPFTSQTVIDVIKKVQDPAIGAANQAIAAQISSATAAGDDKVVLQFKKALPNIFDLFETMPMLNMAKYADYAAGKSVDGTGKFRWDSWTPGGQIKLSKNTAHRDAQTTPLDGIEISIIKDPTALLNAVRSGKVSYAFGMPALDAQSLSQQPGYSLVTSGGAAIPLAFDTTKAPFDNKLVRQALQYAIDRDRIVKQVYAGQATAASLPWRSNSSAYDKDQAARYSYQPDKAAALIKQAGAEGASFNVVTLNSAEATGVFQIVQNNLAAIGLKATGVPLAAADYDGRIAKRDMGAPVVLMQSSNALSPASAVVSRPELLATNGLTKFSTPDYTKIVQDLTGATSSEAAHQAALKYNEYFLDQAFAVPLLIRPSLSVRSTGIDGVKSTQTGFIDLTQAALTR